MQEKLLTDEERASEQGRQIIERLRAGKLPQMVDWFDPGLLVKVGVRSVISATLGSYTDQRLIQAATDDVASDDLAKRYDYSETGNPDHAIIPDENRAFWVDYIADLGDGFEATYAMAYLLAAEKLKVDGASDPLPAGKLLIMGGDQVYPDATKAEYHTRLRDPYDWAFSASGKPQRKLFAIPGNHDWYDGLSAFSALFCSARDRISRGKGVQIGGWRCYQNRSYFAIKLPHNWWIWGPDIQLADNLDDSQRDYFDLMSERATQGHKIILCLAEPSWLHESYDNMHEISLLARQHGAKICAVIAGDWHHYSRYTDADVKAATAAADRLNIQFITCGGGGAFAHATHGLKPSIDLRWARRTGVTRVSDPRDTTEFNRTEETVIRAEGPDFTLQKRDAGAKPPGDAAAENPAAKHEATPSSGVAPEPKPSTDLNAGPQGFKSRKKRERAEDIAKKADTYTCKAQAIYPPKLKSRLLCLKNLALPFRNRPFTYLVGVVYFVYAWAFVAADPRQSAVTQNVLAGVRTELSVAQSTLDEAKRHHNMIETQLKLRPSGAGAPVAGSPESMMTEMLSRQLKDAEGSISERKQIVDLVQQRYDATQGEGSAAEREAFKNRLDQIFNDQKLGFGGKLLAAAGALAANTLAYVLDVNALRVAAEQSPMFAFMLLGLWAGLVGYVESNRRWVRLLIGTLHAAAHIVALLAISWLANTTGIVPRLFGSLLHISDALTRILWNVVVTLFVGGLVGGFIMGIYWTLTSTLLNMHTGDAFGALGIKDYKNFLRIKLEPDRATIYPVALDTVPGRRGWRWKLNAGEVRPAHRPLVLPVEPLRPRLIEKPIMIDVADTAE